MWLRSSLLWVTCYCHILVMRHLLSLVFLVLLIGIQGAKIDEKLAEIEDRYGNGKYTQSKFFEGTLDLLQGAVIDIQYAFEDLEEMEKRLQYLDSQKYLFDKSWEVLSTNLDMKTLKNDFKHENVKVQ